MNRKFGFTVRVTGVALFVLSNGASSIAADSKIVVSNPTNGTTKNAVSIISDPTSGAYINIRRDGSNEWFLQADPTATNNLNFRAGNLTGTPKMVMTFAGNVGIGTIQPSEKLEVQSTVLVSNPVNGSQANVADLSSSATYGGYLHLRRDGSNEWFIQANPHAAVNTLNISAGNISNAAMMSISAKGVGIHKAQPAHGLDVDGDAAFTQNVTASNFTMTSDKRLKQRIQPLSSELKDVLSLKPVSFYWNGLASERGIHDSSQQIGFLAQEVEQKFPQVVRTSEDGYKSVSYPALISPVVAAIQEFYERWKNDSSAKDAKITALEKRIDQLEKLLNERSLASK